MTAANIHPLHLADLRKSGLSDSIIEAAGLYSVVEPENIKAIMGWLPTETTLLAFPYTNSGGFVRYKLFPPLQRKDTARLQKYYQTKDSGIHLYQPPGFDPNADTIYITEGEKKTLRAQQAGLNCLGLGGIWNFAVKDENNKPKLVDDFATLDLINRKVALVPDSDFQTKIEVKHAVYRIGIMLEARGAEVAVVCLPVEPHEGKLDDYLCRHTVEEFHELKRLPLKHKIFADVRKKETRAQKAGKEAILPMTALFPGLVDIVEKEGGPVFLVKDGNSLRIKMTATVEGIEYAPPDKKHLPFWLPQADACLANYPKNDDALFDDLVGYFHRFSFLPDEDWLVIALYVFGTYLQDHPDIHYQAMIFFHAVPERGKSRTGKAIIYVAYRGIHLVDMRETNIFRFSANLGATIFFDIMDIWKKVERNGSEDVLLLRYEKGAKVSRVLYPERGAFADTVHYSIGGPTIMSSNTEIHKILGSRCLTFSMPNSPRNYENPTPEFGLKLKERLVAWRARVMDKSLPEVRLIEGITGRLWDITKPLFQICKLVAPEKFETLVEVIEDIAAQRVQEKKESFDGLLVQIIYEMTQDDADHYDISTSEITERFNKLWNGDKPKRPEWTGRKLKALGIPTDTKSRVSMARLSRRELNVLLSQYGYDTPVKSSKTSNTSQTVENTNTYPFEVFEDGKNLERTSKEVSVVNSDGCKVVEVFEDIPVGKGFSTKADKNILESANDLSEAELEEVTLL